jgi:hypothetical protein
MSSKSKRGTYIWQIDHYGDISAYVNSFIVSQESYARSIGQELGKEGMRQYYLHLDDAELAKRHPDIIRKAPPIEPVRPLHTDDNFFELFKLFEIDVKLFNIYHQCVEDLISAFFDMLLIDDQNLLRSIDPINGMASVTLNMMYKHVMTRHGEFTDSAQRSLHLAIEGPLSLSESLESNLTKMQVANTVLTSHNMGYSENLLYLKAFAKLHNNPRTREIADDYKKREGFAPSKATFIDFKKYVISQYDVRTPPPSTAAYAFANEVKEDLIESFAAATISTEKSDAPTKQQFDALVAKVNSLLPNQTGNQHNSGNPKPAPAYCFLHGYGYHGNSTLPNTPKAPHCKSMSDDAGNPRPTFTKDQIMCKTANGGPIGGVARSQFVMKGCTKP